MEPWKRLQYAEDGYTYKHWTKLVSWGKSKGISGIFYEKKVGCCWYRLSRQWTAKKNEWGNSYFGNSVIKLTEIAETPVMLLSKYCCSLSGYFEKKLVSCLHIDPIVPLRCIQWCWAHGRHLLNLEHNMLIQVNRALWILILGNLVCIWEYKWGFIFCYSYVEKLNFSLFQDILWLVIKILQTKLFFIDSPFFHAIFLKIRKMHVLWQACKS